MGDRAQFFVKDYSDTGFPSEQYDAIFTLETLVHSPNVERTLAELYRILKPGGSITHHEYSLASDDQFTPRERGIVALMNEESAMTSLPRFRFGVLGQLLRETGFIDVKTEDDTAGFLPSLRQYYHKGFALYQPVRLLGLGRRFPNVTSMVEMYPIARKGLIRYDIVTARKPEE